LVSKIRRKCSALLQVLISKDCFLSKLDSISEDAFWGPVGRYCLVDLNLAVTGPAMLGSATKEG